MNRNIDLPHAVFLASTVIVGLSVFFIFGFLFMTAAPVLEQEGIGFIIGTEWNYETHTYGILNFIAGTLALTAVTLVLAVPLSLFTAIFLAEWAPAWLEQIMRPPIEMLVGIPSVVYGLFGFFFLEKVFRYHVDPAISGTLGQFIPIFHDPAPHTGLGILLASTILAIMILPTVTALSQEAMMGVSREWKEGSLAIGATKWQTIRRVVVPAAMPGIITAIILGIMRAVGETMAVLMLMGGKEHIPTSILDGGTAMTSKIIADIGYYASFGEPRAALFAIGGIIFLMEILFVAAARAIGKHYTKTR
jgi:phosphate transport system permease protein